jgi:hypothetical protein
VDHGPVDDALNAGCRRRLRRPFDLEGTELGLYEFRNACPKLVEIYRARLHYGLRIAIVDQCEQEMLERCVFMIALVREFERAVESRLESRRE